MQTPAVCTGNVTAASCANWGLDWLTGMTHMAGLLQVDHEQEPCRPKHSVQGAEFWRGAGMDIPGQCLVCQC